jgi:hypothetical protein
MMENAIVVLKDIKGSPMRAFVTAVIFSLLVTIACLAHALQRYHPYASHVEVTQQEADLSAREVKQSKDCTNCQPKTKQDEEEGTEFWPPFLGYRLKVTDTLVAAFTALLFVATYALFVATRNLVSGADRTAERQLRAYIYVQKTKLTFANNIWDHSFRIKNFGMTPAHNVRLVSNTEVVDWNDGAPTIPRPTEVVVLGSMAPNGDFFDNENVIDGNVTIAELQNETKAVFLVGVVTYDTVFGGPHQTNFRYYVGGDCAYLGGEMYADDAGNEAT